MLKKSKVYKRSKEKSKETQQDIKKRRRHKYKQEKFNDYLFILI